MARRHCLRQNDTVSPPSNQTHAASLFRWLDGAVCARLIAVRRGTLSKPAKCRVALPELNRFKRDREGQDRPRSTRLADDVANYDAPSTGRAERLPKVA